MADKKRQILLSEDKSEEYKPSWTKRVAKALKSKMQGKLKVKGGALSYEPTKVDSFVAGKRRSHPKAKRHFGIEYERKY